MIKQCQKEALWLLCKEMYIVFYDVFKTLFIVASAVICGYITAFILYAVLIFILENPKTCFIYLLQIVIILTTIILTTIILLLLIRARYSELKKECEERIKENM